VFSWLFLFLVLSGGDDDDDGWGSWLTSVEAVLAPMVCDEASVVLIGLECREPVRTGVGNGCESNG